MRVLWLPADNGGCGFYRIIQPALTIAKMGLAESKVLNRSRSAELEDWLANCDVLVTQRQKWSPSMAKYKETHPDTLIVDENDDNMYLTDPYSGHYRDTGTREVIEPDPTGELKRQWGIEVTDKRVLPDGSIHLWKDGEDGFDIVRNVEKVRTFNEALTESDILTTTGPDLRNVFKKFNHRTYTIPNAIDFTKWGVSDKQKKEIRIGWHGGMSHYKDWYDVMEPLGELFKSNKKLKLVITGDIFEGIYKYVPREQIEHHSWVHIMAHPYFQRLLKIDIAFIPLADNEFNRCKSDVKFLEFSAMGVPCVVANMTPYKETVGYNKLGLTYNSTDEAIVNLKMFIDNPKLRKEYGDKANTWVHENRDILGVAPGIVELFQEQRDKKVNKICLA